MELKDRSNLPCQEEEKQRKGDNPRHKVSG